MRVEGKVWKDKKFWLIEVPAMDLMTQAKSRSEAFDMLKDAIGSLQNKKRFPIKFAEIDHKHFYVSSTHAKQMVAFILLRLRTKKGLSLEDVRERLGAKSRNAYSQYEQGRTEPSVSKMDELLQALDFSLVVNAA